MAGIAVPSLDRVGRLFPLTAASPCHPAGPDTISDASDWFRQIESALVSARDRRESADRLASELAALPFKRPQRLSVGKSRKGLWLWAENSAPAEADPEDPSSVLDELLVPVGEAR
jgi:type VI secretion system protein ImpM